LNAKSTDLPSLVGMWRDQVLALSQALRRELSSWITKSGNLFGFDGLVIGENGIMVHSGNPPWNTVGQIHTHPSTAPGCMELKSFGSAMDVEVIGNEVRASPIGSGYPCAGAWPSIDDTALALAGAGFFGHFVEFVASPQGTTAFSGGE